MIEAGTFPVDKVVTAGIAAKAIVGLHAAARTVKVGGQAFENRTPAVALARSLALVSEDRPSDQIFAGRSMRD